METIYEELQDGHEHTFFGLKMWYCKIMHKFAMIFVCHHKARTGDIKSRAKVAEYVIEIVALHNALLRKRQQVISDDWAEELRIMDDKLLALAAASREFMQLEFQGLM